jgi:hypothetical protein
VQEKQLKKLEFIKPNVQGFYLRSLSPSLSPSLSMPSQFNISSAALALQPKEIYMLVGHWLP